MLSTQRTALAWPQCALLANYGPCTAALPHAASWPQPVNAAKLPPADCPRVAELAEVVLGQQQGALRSAMDASEGEGVRVRVCVVGVGVGVGEGVVMRVLLGCARLHLEGGG